MTRQDRNEETMESIDYDGLMQANAVRSFVALVTSQNTSSQSP